MPKYGDARIHMNDDLKNKIKFLCGEFDDLERISNCPSFAPFDEDTISFLDLLSKEIMKDAMAKEFPDVATFAFWIRRSNIMKLKARFLDEDDFIRMGRGVTFHISPSNVAVNFAYSLVSALVCGNPAIVRVPSKEFIQIDIIAKALNNVIISDDKFKGRIFLIRYDRDKGINDYLSKHCMVRIIWGGDETIREIRKSEIMPRARDIVFADRYSIAFIDSNEYLKLSDKNSFMRDFYNDTYLTDQNACTSPRVIVWYGNQIADAKHDFWNGLDNFLQGKYEIQNIQAVNKLTSMYLLFSAYNNGDESADINNENKKVNTIKYLKGNDNTIVRISVDNIDDDIMQYMDNSGYFFEYDCNDIMSLRDLCDNEKCQTLSYLGDAELFTPLIESGIRGIDRIVPIGHTMYFDLKWDGYDLVKEMTRVVDKR